MKKPSDQCLSWLSSRVEWNCTISWFGLQHNEMMLPFVGKLMGESGTSEMGRMDEWQEELLEEEESDEQQEEDTAHKTEHIQLLTYHKRLIWLHVQRFPSYL